MCLQEIKTECDAYCALRNSLGKRNEKKYLILKHGSGSTKMNKHTCLYTVAQWAQEEDGKMEHLSGADGTCWFVLWLQCWGKTELG